MRIGMLCFTISLLIADISLISCTFMPLNPQNLSDATAFSFNWSGISPDTKVNSWLWTEKYMVRMMDRKILTENDLKNPYKSLSRAEFIHWMIRDMKKEPLVVDHPFMDIETDHPYYFDIMQAYHQDIIEEDSFFSPDEPLLRSEAAKWLIRAKAGEALEGLFQMIPEPVIPAQDGYIESAGDVQRYLALSLLPEHQLMYYRWKNGSEFRYIEANRPISRAEAAYGLYHLRFPPQREASLVIGYFNERQHAKAHQFSDMLFSPVIGGRDEQWSYYPLLIKQIPSLENGLWKMHDDGSMEVTFHFREKLHWSDGTLIDAHDAVYAHQLKLAAALPTNNEEIVSWIQKVEAIDRHTYKTYWSQPYPYANLHIEVFPRQYIETNKLSFADYMIKPLHAGPYLLSNDEDEQKELCLHANPKYLLGQPLFETITLIPFDCDETLYAAWNNDELHIAFYRSNPSQKASKQFVFQPTLRWEHLDLSTDHPFLADSSVRHALLYSINRKQLTEELFSHPYPIAHSYFPPEHPSYHGEKITLYPYDLNKASQIMDEAGWTIDPESQLRKKNDHIFKITLISVKDDPMREKILDIISADWKKLNISVEIVTENSDHFFSNTLGKRDFHGAVALLYSWNFRAESNLYTVLHSNMIPTQENAYKGQNYSSFSHALVDEILMDNFRRIEPLMLNQNLSVILGIMSHELPSLPLFFYPGILSVDPHLEKIHHDSGMENFFYNIAWWYRQ